MDSKKSKEIKIGMAMLVAIAVLYLGINFLKGINTFNQGNIYYVEFADVKELAKSSPVYADGYQVGIVRDIGYDYQNPGHVVVTIDVDKELRIPKGSSAELESAVLGGCTMKLLLVNNPRERHNEGDTIQGNNDPGLMQQAANMVPQVESILAHVDSLVVAVNTLVTDTNLVGIINNTQQLTANLTRTTTQLETLLNRDLPAVLNTYNEVGEKAAVLADKFNDLELQRTMDELNTTLANLKDATDKLGDTDNSLGQLLNTTTLHDNLNATMRSADSLLNDLREHPKRYVHFSVFGKKEK